MTSAMTAAGMSRYRHGDQAATALLAATRSHATAGSRPIPVICVANTMAMADRAKVAARATRPASRRPGPISAPSWRRHQARSHDGDCFPKLWMTLTGGRHVEQGGDDLVLVEGPVIGRIGPRRIRT